MAPRVAAIAAGGPGANRSSWKCWQSFEDGDVREFYPFATGCSQTQPADRAGAGATHRRIHGLSRR
ncbi:ABC transporter, periplasmic substrate-binding domain protein [Burkholderia pseudomallei MSHR5613]|nr:ABC transporter, periplasmic substrate-binding domain protein [Burkholderia pseudomallei MSHR5492]KGS39254.1 ABC transporter, periplasmic substrate-binding domain protein [Burkholderia pseudomallei MSHR5613]KGX05140.1 ABC transporter, periplasmic substrate-binding domain protein [Burkholderia pseudomallei MSHR640]KOT09127.1 ABC transporter, periplasmic substrate-binding domain protein [Burkholderia mallei]KOT21919.1 ABC transporter, periplasmic substrate-binding domain protein [Burkholderia 